MAYPYCVIISILMLYVCVQQVSGADDLFCYVCNSHNDTRCSMDRPPTDFNTSCKSLPRPKDKLIRQYTLCRKIKQVIDFEVNGLPPDTRIIRTCGWDESQASDRCYQRSGFGGRQEVCACKTNNCNGSTTILASLSLILTLFTLQKIYH